MNSFLFQYFGCLNKVCARDRWKSFRTYISQQKNDKFFYEESCCQHDSKGAAVKWMDTELVRDEDPTEE